MGLDMYLTKKIFIGAEFEHRNVKSSVAISIGEKPVVIRPERISYVEESSIYWRKCNQIHNWFVQNVQAGEDDCKSYLVSREQLTELMNLCKTVIESLKASPKGVKSVVVGHKGKEALTEEMEVFEETSLAEELLPATSGFFFGSTDYDKYYLQDLEYTAAQLEAELAASSESDEFYYQSSW